VAARAHTTPAVLRHEAEDLGTEKPENVPFENGYLHDTIQFPA
jgi:hypothetical protein